MRPLIMVLRRLVTVADRRQSVGHRLVGVKRRRELLVSSERALMRIEQRIACQQRTLRTRQDIASPPAVII